MISSRVEGSVVCKFEKILTTAYNDLSWYILKRRRPNASLQCEKGLLFDMYLWVKSHKLKMMYNIIDADTFKKMNHQKLLSIDEI